MSSSDAGASPPVYHVLWTGGWDSTFRVADLLVTHGRAVQPWYVVDPERRTADKELAVMSTLAASMARIRPAVRQLLHPLRVVHLADLPEDPEVEAAAQRIGDEVPMGAQYSWLPRLVPLVGWQELELCHEDDAEYKFVPFDGFDRSSAAPPDDWFTVREATCDPDRWRVFGCFRYPILDITKSQMADLARARGFADVLDRTWTCRWPTVLGNPCGQCLPCQQVRDAGLSGRVPPDTAVRRTLHHWRWRWVRIGGHARARAGAVWHTVRG